MLYTERSPNGLPPAPGMLFIPPGYADWTVEQFFDQIRARCNGLKARMTDGDRRLFDIRLACLSNADAPRLQAVTIDGKVLAERRCEWREILAPWPYEPLDNWPQEFIRDYEKEHTVW
jgi:hypothetical protein